MSEAGGPGRRCRPVAAPIRVALAIVASGLAPGPPAAAQEPGGGATLLVLQELDREGNRHRLASGGVADLNGTLVVGLGGEAIREEVLRRFGPSEGGAEIIADLVALQAAVEEGRQGLAALEGLVPPTAEEAAAVDTAALRVAIQRVAGPGLALVNATERIPELAARAEEVFGAVDERVSVADQYRLLFDVTSAYVDRLEARLERTVREDGVYVQLGAWILTDGGARPVHLPYFDTYPVREAYEVEAFQLVLTDETRADFQRAMRAARAIESGEPGRRALAAAEGLARRAEALVATCAATLDGAVRELDEAGGGDVAAVLAAARELVTALALARAGIAARTRSFSELADAPPAERIAAVTSVGRQLDTLRSLLAGPVLAARELGTAARNVRTTPAAGPVAVAVDALLGVASECGEPLSAAAGGSLEMAREAFTLLAATGAANDLVLEFGEEVERVSLDALPAETSASLLTAGSRDLGDRLVVRLAAGAADRPREVLDERRVGLYHMGWYGRTTAGLIFAHPSSGTAVRRYFHPAPSYSVLVKHGSRRRPSVNTFWTPGFGLNVTSLDFDHDDDPELGVAVVAALVRDYLQIGYGYNLGADRPYWFFGLRLPGTSFTLSPGTSADVEETL